MTHAQERATSEQAGFTLVELAVVMIIIGLLIGGVLKGQELINNAQITATVSQIKAIDAATTTFRDMYDALPGDITNASNRLPSCTTAPCSNAGDGDTRIDNGAATIDLTTAPGAGEGQAFFSHLSAADLITGINPGAGAAAWGGWYPSAEIGGGFHAAYGAGNIGGSNTNARAGHYLLLSTVPNGAPVANTLTPNQAQRIDSKLDDGVANAGGVFDDGGCDTGGDGQYDEAVQTIACDLFIRFQN